MEKSIGKKTKQWWQPKAGNILMAVYLSVYLNGISFEGTLIYIIPAIVTILGIGLFGHLINDWIDLPFDAAAGKNNMLTTFSPGKRLLFLTTTLFVAFIPWLFLPLDLIGALLLGFEFLLLIVYAIPPFRLKNKGIIGLCCDSLYAHVVPFLLAFYTFSLLTSVPPDWKIVISFSIWQFFAGFFNIAIHQIEDYENDLKSGTITWATITGKAYVRKVAVRVFWTGTVISFAAFLFLVSFTSSPWYFSFPLLILLIQFLSAFSQKQFSSYVHSLIPADLQKINIHYHHFLPSWQLLLLCFIDVRFVILFAAHFLLFRYNTIVTLIKPAASYTVNYSIYYFRRLILLQSVKKAKREFYVPEIDDRKLRKEVQLALVNANRSKYTETFVNLHLNWLNESGYNVHQLYGEGIPEAESRRGLLLSNNQTLNKFYKWKESLLGLGENYFRRKAFKNYLIDHNIQLVLAEFGISGAKIAPVCQEIDVPLVVTFYGYDTHHLSVLNAHKNEYEALFATATLLIGVSREIVSRLVELGAPAEKTMYLPCAIELNDFPYIDHSRNPPVFLSVGRFAETKSPHLTILAFNEVLKEIPDAQLVMIGKDGGGELFEACMILVKALNIAEHVIFRGICSPLEVQHEMKHARIFVQHSLTTPLHGDKEGTPVAIMEAMASGLPVISTRHAGIAELISSGKNGILVEEYDYQNMAREMIRVCQSDSLVNTLGKNASDSIRHNVLIAQNKELFIAQVEKFRKKNHR